MRDEHAPFFSPLASQSTPVKCSKPHLKEEYLSPRPGKVNLVQPVGRNKQRSGLFMKTMGILTLEERKRRTFDIVRLGNVLCSVVSVDLLSLEELFLVGAGFVVED
jgi:hypothetical protein